MRPARYALRPAAVASRMASAIRTASWASAMAVFMRMASAPSSMASAASEAVPTPASTMSGTSVMRSRRMRRLDAFWMPRPEPMGAASGMTAAAPASMSLRITEVPLIVDAGVGTASDAAEAIELGADGILMNTAIAEAQDAVLMAEAMRDATAAGRKAYLAGRMPKRLYAAASSPLSGVVR